MITVICMSHWKTKKQSNKQTNNFLNCEIYSHKAHYFVHGTIYPLIKTTVNDFNPPADQIAKQDECVGVAWATDPE